jgi:hypothetical protein
MKSRPYAVLGSALLAMAMWLWVQHIAIPHQQAESAALGIPRGNLSDLYPRWLGARELLLHHRDPYSAGITREIQTGYYGRPIDAARPNDPSDQQAFAYPVYVAFLLAPTIYLPFSLVQHAFLWMLIFVTAGSVLLWLQALGWRISTQAKLVWIILVLGCFPAMQGFKLQQLTLLVAAMIALAMLAVARRYLVIAGVLLACATIKPQLVALLVVWLGTWVAGNWRKRQRLLWGFAAAMALLVMGAEILLPGWIGEFRSATAAYYRYTGGGRSVVDVLISPAWGKVLAVLLAGAALVRLWKLRHAKPDAPEFHWALSLVMATTLAIIPMFAPYNQLLLVPALLVIARAVRPLWAETRRSRFLLGLSGLSIFWPWIAAAGLVFALLFLPSATVQRAWPLPLYSSLAIPIAILALLLGCRKVLCGAEG